MEYVIKILMNSLYGKFGQKFLNRYNWIPFNHTLEELNKLKYFERIGDFIRVKKDYQDPAAFCIPIWALHVTAKARLKLHDAILKTKPVYVDTDSLMTQEIVSTSDELGDLKLEMYIEKGIIVKPKMYSIISNKGDYVKVKGVAKRFKYDEFKSFLKNPSVTYKKFMKFKESIRRGFIPNEIRDMTKDLDLEDNKREWTHSFNPEIFQESIPLEVKHEGYKEQIERGIRSDNINHNEFKQKASV